MQISSAERRKFQRELFTFYDQHGRHDLPWRITCDSYAIMVSEIMLQQTQVGRVIPKFQAFLQQFPSVRALASASLGDVLVAWQGLGYNRRAKFLWQAAQMIEHDFAGVFPREPNTLVKLPGIGKNTAGAILAYAFNQPALFVETNIRTVFIHYFWPDQQAVSDNEIVDVLGQVIDTEQPREFYWALMDYGTHLKTTVGNNIKRSKHYAKQSPFDGSRRQVRGAVIRTLIQRGHSLIELQSIVPDPRLPEVLNQLKHEKMITLTDDIYHLA
ncbi:A/G-specific adenine glycosylase [Candidatus Saccharibacteria bacterium]|nr:A/G-specific adenine glycosylase [Candidatus Saccharibacteria bacterium]